MRTILSWICLLQAMSCLAFAQIPNIPCPESFKYFLKINTSTPVCSIAWGKDDSVLAYGTESNIEIYNINSGDVINKLNGNIKKVNCLAWDTDSEKLAAGCQDGIVIIWNVISGGKFSLNFGSPVYSIAWLADLDRLSAACDNGIVYVVDTHTVSVVKQFQSHICVNNSSCWSADSSMLAIAGFYNSIEIWKLDKNCTQPGIIGIVPNPARDAVEVNYQIMESGYIKLHLVDYLGQTLDIINECFSPAGDFTASVNTSLMPQGLYFIVLHSPVRTDIKKFEVIR